MQLHEYSPFLLIQVLLNYMYKAGFMLLFLIFFSSSTTTQNTSVVPTSANPEPASEPASVTPEPAPVTLEPASVTPEPASPVHKPANDLPEGSPETGSHYQLVHDTEGAGGADSDLTSFISPAVKSGDFGKLKSQRQLTADEKYYLLKHHLVPDKYFNFPVNSIVDHNRKFQNKWLDEYNGLVYSVVDDSGYCKYCVMFGNYDPCQELSALVNRLSPIGIPAIAFPKAPNMPIGVP